MNRNKVWISLEETTDGGIIAQIGSVGKPIHYSDFEALKVRLCAEVDEFVYIEEEEESV